MIKPPHPYRLRSMRLSDIYRVMEIERQAFPTPWRASAYEYEISRNRLATYLALTVEQDGQPAYLVGYAGYWLLVDEAHISTIAVDPNWRGRGLGELLLLSLLDLACSSVARLATLEVRRHNTVAQSLYTKYRFQLVGERPRYYQNKDDALIMTAEPLDDNYRVFLRGRRRELFERLADPDHSPADGRP